MQYQITLPNGEVVYVDESVPPKVAAETIKQQRKELFKTNLLSAGGLKSLFTTPGDLIDASAANTMAGLYRIKEGLLQYGQDTYPDPRRQQSLEEARQKGHEYAAAGRALEQKAEMQAPNPSWPLEAAQSLAPSLAQMPAALLSLGLVPTAQAYNQAKSQGVDNKNAAAYASIAGPAELLSEIPLAKAFKELGKEPVKQVILKLLARDIGSENLNVIAEHLAEQAFVTPDRPLKEALEEYVHKAAVATMAAGGQTAVVGAMAKTGEVIDRRLAGRTPGITNRNPRDVPQPSSTQPPPPPPAPKFTDIEAELAPLMSEIRDLEAKVDEGLELPENPITATPVEPTKPPAMQVLDARQGYDTGMSAEVLRNSDNFEDPNTILNRSDRLVTRAIGIDESVGLRWGETDLEKIKLTPGPIVLQVGEDSNVRPAHYMQGLIQDLYNLALEFNPQGKYVVLPEDLATKEQKAKAAQGGHFYQNGIHYIIPRWQTNQNEFGSHTSKEGKGKYNPFTKMDAYSTLGHEFGHSLIEDFFFQGLTPEERTALRTSLEAGQADLTLAAKLAPTAQKILADWAELRTATLENRISAKEAAARWLSPSKLQKKVIQKELGFGARNFTAKRFADKVGIEYQLSFDEYLAEQVAKAMFTQERMEKSEILKAAFAENVDAGGILSGMEVRLAEFFGPLLDTLKQLYNRLTAMGIAGPADSTLAWLEELGENARLAGERKVAGKKTKQAAPVERPVDEPAKSGQYYATLRSLRLAGLVKRNSKHHRQLTRMLKQGDFEGFLREIEPLLGAKLRQDITEVKGADIRGIRPAWIVGTGSPNKWTKHAEFGKHNENISRRLWREKKTDSPNFQSWFAGSKAVTYSGNPLKLHFNTSLTFKDLEGREFYVGSENYMRMLEIADLATGGNAHPKHTRIIPGWLAIKNIKQLPPPEYGLSPSWLSQEVMQARKEGYDGLVVYGDRKNDSLWIGLAPDTATYDPDYKHTGNEAVEFEGKLRSDTITEEGEATTSKWKLLRSKLNLPYLADGITALSNLQYWGLQTQQLGWMNPSWNWLANFSSDLQKFYRKIGQMHSRADTVVRQLQWFGKENLALIYKFTKAEYKGGEHWTELRRVGDTGYWEHVPTEKTLQKLKEFGVDVDTAKGQKFLRIYIEAKNALQYQMDEMQRVLYGLAARKYSSPTRMAERNQKFQEIAVTFKLYRGVPFWPQHSFGKYRVQVWASNDIGKLLVYENASDSITEAEKILQQAKKKYPGKIVQFRKVTPNQTLIQRLPAEFLDDLEVILELDRDDPNDVQKLQEIRDAMQSLYAKVPEQAYNPLRRVVEGGSTDFIKIYADFALRNANFIAKMEHKALLQKSIAQAEQEANEQETMRGKANILRAVEFMQGTLNYAMDPHEEMAQLRGVIAITYLWANVKTALLNFWGLVHTLGVLNRELGYVKGTSTFGKAVLSAVRTQGHEWGSFLVDVVKGSAETALVSVTDPNWEMVDGKPTELRLALEQAKQENVLDQSYAYYLATQAMRGQLIRMASASLPGKIFKGSVDAGMSLFRGTELLIRRTTFIATYKALQQSQPELTPKERYEKATRMTLLLQGDYTKGNRPQLMRGNLLSFITIFMTFVQTASWNAYGGMEIGLRRQEAMEGRASPAFYRSYTAQLILLYLFVAGLEGLPGMENALDILDALFKKWNNGKSARQGIYEVLNDLDQDPLKWTRGVTFNLGGFDISRSIGLGRLVPGTDVLASEHGKTKEFLGDFVGTASGIGGGYVQWVVDSMSAMGKAAELGLDPAKTAKDQVARLPGGIGNIFKAAQWAQVDARGPSGALLAFDEKTQMAREIEWWEITGKALGFQPASISRTQYIKGAQYDSRVFWSARRKLLLDNLMQAQEIAKDREATADARRAIEVFNSKVPTASLRITQDTIKKSLERRKAAIKAAEQYMPTQKSLEGLYREQVELLGGSME